MTPVYLVCLCRCDAVTAPGLDFGFSFSALLLLVTRGGRDWKTPFLLCVCERTRGMLSTLLPPERLTLCSSTYRLRETTIQSSSPPGHSHPLALSTDSLEAADFLPPVARTSLSSLVRSASVVRQRADASSSMKPASYDRKNIQHGSSYQVLWGRSVSLVPQMRLPATCLLIFTFWLFA